MQMIRNFIASKITKKVTVGLCTMEKKASSKQMQTLINRLEAFGEFETVIFPQDVILNEPIENWPLCDCLIAFHSTGFPIEKTERYIELRKPFAVNECSLQSALLNRERVYALLREHNIATPRHLVYHDPEEFPDSTQTLIEHEDAIEIDGVKLSKPFVEKPLDAEDHNIYLYYPKSAGGGSKRLFRKIENRSSEFYPTVNNIRKGSFIYEEFLPTEGTDVKVYTIGVDYAHAEARKSPVVDGRVKRNADGKEIRYPVILTPEEKEMARKIVLAFKQRVCGFDLLRTSNGSCVCDVNGWSFVKNSRGYYDDAAQILRILMLRAVAPSQVSRIPPVRPTVPVAPKPQRPHELMDDRPVRSGSPGSEEELRCVVAVVRHGDRTPKQKLKIIVTGRPYLELFELYGKKSGPREVLKMKSAVKLQAVLDITRSQLQQYQEDPTFSGDPFDSETRAEKIEKLNQVRAVLEKGGYFSGINRKIQLKPMKWQPAHLYHRSDSDHSFFPPITVSGNFVGLQKVGSYNSVPPSPQMLSSSSGSISVKKNNVQVNEEMLRKLVLQPTSVPSSPVVHGPEVVVQALFILKWGGELTHTGRQQAQEQGGKLLADMYPSEDSFLQLHSTYRHDLKIYASDEGRVEMTAAAYAKGLLNLEGELTPILVSLVHQTDKLLERMSLTLHPELRLANEQWEEIKTRLHDIMHMDRDTMDEEMVNKAVPTKSKPLLAALENVGNPIKTLGVVLELVRELIAEVEKKWPPEQRSEIEVCEGELLSSMLERWRKLHREFFRKESYDTRKLPDIYDCIKYDYLHNQQQLKLETAPKLYQAVAPMGALISPQEYGITAEEKLKLAKQVVQPLMKKILMDLQLAAKDQANSEELIHRLDTRYVPDGMDSPAYHVRSRFYFTSESHILTLLNILRYCNYDPANPDAKKGVITPDKETYLDQTSEYNYLTHIVFRLFEVVGRDKMDPARWRVELLLSPGVSTKLDEIDINTHTAIIHPLTQLNGSLTLQEMEEILKGVCS